MSFDFWEGRAALFVSFSWRGKSMKSLIFVIILIQS